MNIMKFVVSFGFYGQNFFPIKFITSWQMFIDGTLRVQHVSTWCREL